MTGAAPEPPDDWDHDVWVAAWRHNAPRWSVPWWPAPRPPAGEAWLVRRMLVRGKKTLEVSLTGNPSVVARVGLDGDPVASTRSLLDARGGTPDEK